MLVCITEPRKELSPFAPKIQQIKIPGDRIGELIGPGGKNIKALIEETGAGIDVDEDPETGEGLVNISSTDQAVIDKTVNTIESMFRELTVGEEFDGVITRIEDYGCFVEFLPGREGLVHVSAMAADFVSDPSSIVSMGETVHVRVAVIKDDGKIGLSMLSQEQEDEARSNRPSRPPFRGGRDGGSSDRGGYRGDRGGDRNSRPRR